jgi:vacuolar-type H+-ATPase subunit I/STV1
MRHERITLVLLALWAMGFSHVVKAATLQEFMGPYDASLLYWAAVTAFMGGVLRSIFGLQSQTIDRRTLSEAAWDAGRSLVAGLFAFWIIQALRSYDYAVPNEIRFGAVLVAGILRFTWLGWMADAGLAWANARKEQIINRPMPDNKDAP